jgi:hypothetical protein
LAPNLSTKSLTAKSKVQRVNILRGCANSSEQVAQIVLGDCVNYGRSRREKYILAAASADPRKAEVSYRSPEGASFFS